MSDHNKTSNQIEMHIQPKEKRILKSVAAAPGKVILLGEHFVVYGAPALAMAINRYVQVTVESRQDSAIYISSTLGVSGSFEGGKFTPEIGGVEAARILEPIRIAAETTMKSLGEKCGLNIEVDSTIPIAAGLGSSGAVAVSTVAAVGKLFGKNLIKRKIVSLSTEAERYVHGNASGIDQAISTYGGVISYVKDKGVSHLSIKSPIPIVIGNTGVSRSTERFVDIVRIRMERFPKIMQSLIALSAELTTKGIDLLKRGNLEELGILMDMNHGLLTTLGVSSKELDTLVYAAKLGGTLGVKLTGAGGGGCIVALSRLDNKDNVAKLISAAGGTPIVAEKVDVGVRSWIVR